MSPCPVWCSVLPEETDASAGVGAEREIASPFMVRLEQIPYQLHCVTIKQLSMGKGSYLEKAGRLLNESGTSRRRFFQASDECPRSVMSSSDAHDKCREMQPGTAVEHFRNAKICVKPIK